MARSELIIAINQVCAERGLDPNTVIAAIESALVSAYRKKFGAAQNVIAKIDTKTGAVRVFAELEVVDKVRDRKTQISLEEARKYKPDVKIGEKIIVETTPRDFGRIAAQTAKQVMMQRIREAEREIIYEELKKMEGEVVQGKIQRIDRKKNQIVVNLGHGEGILPKQEQIPRERLRQNDRMYFYVVRVERPQRGGPFAYLSRTHPNFVRRLLEQEVPEIRNGIVEIKAIAREPGARSKVAVAATQPGVDPVGSCVGVRGTRIQAVVNALGGEKIDVIEWNPDPRVFIANALAPAKVLDVVLMEDGKEKRALVIVPDDQLSLAIGRDGQNARLAAKLTGWHIDIKGAEEAAKEGLGPEARQEMQRQFEEKKEADLLAQAAALLQQKVGEDDVAPSGEEDADTSSSQDVNSASPSEKVDEDFDLDRLDALAMEQLQREEGEKASGQVRQTDQHRRKTGKR